MTVRKEPEEVWAPELRADELGLQHAMPPPAWLVTLLLVGALCLFVWCVA